MRPPVRERPVEIRQLCAEVLIAAILRPVIRADGMTTVGACREWPKAEAADDRRDGERVREGNPPHREAYEPKRAVPALDPGGGSRYRPAASMHGGAAWAADGWQQPMPSRRFETAMPPPGRSESAPASR